MRDKSIAKNIIPYLNKHRHNSEDRTIENKILKLLKENPQKFYSSLTIAKKFKMDKRKLFNPIKWLIDNSMVKTRYIYNERKNLNLRLIRHKDGHK